MKNTVNIRLYKATRDRFKIKAIRHGVSMMEYMEAMSKRFLEDDYFSKKN